MSEDIKSSNDVRCASAHSIVDVACTKLHSVLLNVFFPRCFSFLYVIHYIRRNRLKSRAVYQRITLQLLVIVYFETRAYNCTPMYRTISFVIVCAKYTIKMQKRTLHILLQTNIAKKCIPRPIFRVQISSRFLYLVDGKNVLQKCKRRKFSFYSKNRVEELFLDSLVYILFACEVSLYALCVQILYDEACVCLQICNSIRHN